MESKCIIVCQSIYNDNTKRIAKAMSVKLACPVISAVDALETNLDQFEVVGLGSGIYFGCHHPELFNVVKKLSNSQQQMFIFSSRGAPFLGKYHHPIKNALQHKGKNIIGEFSVRGYDETGPFVIVGGGSKGKPDEKDLKKAQKFIERVLPEYCVEDPYKKVVLKGNIQDGKTNKYRVPLDGGEIVLAGDRVTINQTVCNGCGTCARICPLELIKIIDGKSLPVRELDCTLCRLCINHCRQRAIHLHYNWRDAIKVAIRHNKKQSLVNSLRLANEYDKFSGMI